MKVINYLEQKQSRYKPLFKSYLRLRQNVQFRDKFSKFKKKKWGQQLFYFNSKFSRYKLRKVTDPTRIKVSRNPSNHNSLKHHRYRNYLQSVKKLSLYFGRIRKKKLKNMKKEPKKNINNIKNKTRLLEMLESRLDTVLYRAKFTKSMRGAGQLITHGKIMVNNRVVKSKSYQLRPGDIVKISSKKNKLLLLKQIRYSRRLAPKIIKRFRWGRRWGQKIFKPMRNSYPIPAKHLVIDYSILHIVFLGINQSRSNSLLTTYPYYINLQNIMQDRIIFILQ